MGEHRYAQEMSGRTKGTLPQAHPPIAPPPLWCPPHHHGGVTPSPTSPCGARGGVSPPLRALLQPWVPAQACSQALPSRGPAAWAHTKPPSIFQPGRGCSHHHPSTGVVTSIPHLPQPTEGDTGGHSHTGSLLPAGLCPSFPKQRGLRASPNTTMATAGTQRGEEAASGQDGRHTEAEGTEGCRSPEGLPAVPPAWLAATTASVRRNCLQHPLPARPCRRVCHPETGQRLETLMAESKTFLPKKARADTRGWARGPHTTGKHPVCPYILRKSRHTQPESAALRRDYPLPLGQAGPQFNQLTYGTVILASPSPPVAGLSGKHCN